MRNIFIKKLIERAKKNKNIYFLTADLGYSSFEIFKNKFPNRFINVGVAENNMIGIAAGLALLNKEVYVYSIVPFLVFRSLEQIRNNICNTNLNVKIMGGGGGFSYGEQGISHNTSEDLSIMNTLPNLKVFAPGLKNETELMLDVMFKNVGPSYMRLGKVSNFNYNIKKSSYKIGNGILVNEGKDLIIISCGNILENVMEVIQNLKKRKITSKLISFPCIKPIKRQFLKKHLNNKSKIIIIEENTKIGGLGSVIKDFLIENNYNNIVKHICLEDTVHDKIGSQKYLRDINNLSVNKIDKIIKKFLN